MQSDGSEFRSFCSCRCWRERHEFFINPAVAATGFRHDTDSLPKWLSPICQGFRRDAGTSPACVDANSCHKRASTRTLWSPPGVRDSIPDGIGASKAQAQRRRFSHEARLHGLVVCPPGVVRRFGDNCRLRCLSVPMHFSLSCARHRASMHGILSSLRSSLRFQGGTDC